jgi:hypothetical protein
VTEDEARLHLALPWDDPHRMRATARGLVIAAAGGIEDPSTKDWMLTDREGKWEQRAMEALDGLPAMVVASQAEGKPMAERAEWLEALALLLSIRALDAMILHRTKREAARG